jgi:signal-transduction protein with cAMP-binding, CBS, and nucleotidyltransferase domain
MNEGEEMPTFTIKGATVIEKVARAMSEAGVDVAQVLNKKGENVGVIDSATILRAMVTPSDVAA